MGKRKYRGNKNNKKNRMINKHVKVIIRGNIVAYGIYINKIKNSNCCYIKNLADSSYLVVEESNLVII